MRYHDTGNQEPAHALATWLLNTITPGFAELRIQSGYFARRALGTVRMALEAAAATGSLTRVLVGSNDSATLHSDVRRLANLIGVPRDSAQLGIVKFQNALFHPKVYHVRRQDGSQAAFVGSANFTRSGLNGTNVEAAISLDTNDGDPSDVLDEIAAAIDTWFISPNRDGFHLVSSAADIDALLELGILATVRPPKSTASDGAAGGAGGVAGPCRQVLISIPVLPDDDDIDDVPGKEPESEPDIALGDTQNPVPETEIAEAGPIPGDTAAPVELAPTELPVEQLTEFPDYFLFAPGITTETEGFEGLSGLPLPDGATGLLIKLQKANARKFLGNQGSADINIPIAVVKSLRFGRAGVHKRPSTRVQLRIRFIATPTLTGGETFQVVSPNYISTRIAGYGYTAAESGHADVRMNMPSAVKVLATPIQDAGYELPTTGDYFILEWPSEDADCFGLTFIARDSALSKNASAMYSAAETAGKVIGGAVLISADFVPDWP